MAHIVVGKTVRIRLWVTPESKGKLRRAAALRNVDLTSFVTQAALAEADAVIEAAGRSRLSERDTWKVLDFLEAPPSPNAKLRAAMTASKAG